MNLYFPSADLLRGLAALLVCLYHFAFYHDARGELLPDDHLLKQFAFIGEYGVNVFFVVSGFVIPLSMTKSKLSLSSSFRFIIRRLIRIEIPYLASILLFFFIQFVWCYRSNQMFDIDLIQLFHHFFYTIPFTEYNWYNIIYWTLAIEFQFYLIIPFLLFLLTRENKFIRISALISFGMFSLFSSELGFIFRYTPIFCIGLTFFMIQRKLIQWPYSMYLFFLFTALTVHFHTPLTALLCVSSIGIIALQGQMKKKFHPISQISYSLYLIHGFIGGNIIMLCSRYFESDSSKMLLIAIAMVTSIICSFVFYRFIEGPSLKWSKKI